jgi:hypothetical protein
MTTPRLSPALLASLAIAPLAAAQPALYSNGRQGPESPGLATGVVAGDGTPAPAGSAWSEVQRSGLFEANGVGGFAAQAAPDGSPGAIRLADDFTVASPLGWRVRAAAFFAYTPGATAAPFGPMNVRVWSGRPGDAGSQVVWESAGAITGTSVFAGLHRAFSTTVAPMTPPDATRPIWRTTVALGPADGLLLAPGTYWIDWRYEGEALAFTPPVTVVGARTVTGANAIQLRGVPGLPASWAPVIDTGKPSAAVDVAQDLPFLLLGVRACQADLNDDGELTFDDIQLFVGAYNTSDPRADLNEDGELTFDDVQLFIARYNAGC